MLVCFLGLFTQVPCLFKLRGPSIGGQSSSGTLTPEGIRELEARAAEEDMARERKLPMQKIMTFSRQSVSRTEHFLDQFRQAKKLQEITT